MTKQMQDEMVDGVWLTQYLAQAGVCARRKAVALIQQGGIEVNGVPVTTPVYRVQGGDQVVYQGRVLRVAPSQVLLLHKPSGYLTTLHDPHGRKTVQARLPTLPGVRLVPIGRLDRKTTGLLLFTNDGPLAHRLMHPSYGVSKTYHATLERPLTGGDLALLRGGVTLEDGFLKPDSIAYHGVPSCLRLVLHSGRNRIVRRLFAHLGYHVTHLARVAYGGLTLAGVRRGGWRFLTPEEVTCL